MIESAFFRTVFYATSYLFSQLNTLRTKVLSTRWKELSTFVPNLDFTQDSYAKTTRFVEIVDSFFASYNLSYMNKFRFHLLNREVLPYNSPLFSWIRKATSLHVKEIDICADFPIYILVHPDLFCCKTLVVLSLRGRGIILPRSVSLPCLRTCVFEDVWFDDRSARMLFRSCPVLETLLLSSCSAREGQVVDIFVPTLKRLIFHGKIPQLVLDVPNLAYFEYTGGSLSTKISRLGGLKSVVDLATYILELVRSISHVQQLYLNNDLLFQIFLHSGAELPIFNNMTRMRFGPITRSSLRLLLHLLDKAPRLEFLSFEGVWGGGYVEKSDVFPEFVPACVSLHLKEVDFKLFNGLHYEFNLVKYFLKHANNLKAMKMQTGKIWNEQFEVSSEACQILYYSSQLD